MAERLRIEALVAAPVKVAWQRWITPDDIIQWNFASPDWCCPAASVEPRQGGRYSARMEARDGRLGFDFEGIFEVFEAPRHLALRMADGRLAETRFTPEGDATRVVTEFDAEDQNDPEMQRQGWQAILDNFKTHAESA